ncbi:MAG TPA: hypothetical protein VM911_18275 [Pyrinomonadaceae bacterium]|jgi:hypothetical protein|nr:hypothetical protein [Pyrinomonadaceae bacterium]
MPQFQSFDLGKFQEEVLEKLVFIQGVHDYEPKIHEITGTMKELGDNGSWYGKFMGWFLPKVESNVRNSPKRDRARKLIGDEKIKGILCSHLDGIENDAESIARIVTRVLVPEALAEAISIPLDPVVFALCAYEIKSIGVKGYCTI